MIAGLAGRGWTTAWAEDEVALDAAEDVVVVFAGFLEANEDVAAAAAAADGVVPGDQWECLGLLDLWFQGVLLLPDVAGCRA